MQHFYPMRNGKFTRFLSLAALLAWGQAAATGHLPAQRCDPDVLFASTFEPQDEVPPDDSGGSGGPVAAGNYTLMLGSSATTGYYIRIPPGYSAATPAPLLVVLHGA